MDRAYQKGETRRDLRRIGRKALASGRTLALLEPRIPAQKTPRINYTFKRWHGAILLAVLAILGGLWGTQTYLHAQQVANQEAAAAAKTAHAQSVSKKEEACRQSKVQANATKVSTMTYDQLYGNSCDY